MIYGNKYPFVPRISGGYLVIAALIIVLPLVTQNLEAGPAFAADMTVLAFFGLVTGIV